MSRSSTATGSALALLSSDLDLPPATLELLARATPEERTALVESLRSAYERGREEADRKGALQLARIFGALVGMDPVVDRDRDVEGSSLRSRIMERFRRGG